MTLSVLDIIMIIAMSFLTSFTISLNKMAKDRDKKIYRDPLLYLSESFLATISGVLFGLTVSVIQDNKILCIISAAIGSNFGKSGLNVIAKFILQMLHIEENTKEEEQKKDVEKDDKIE